MWKIHGLCSCATRTNERLPPRICRRNSLRARASAVSRGWRPSVHLSPPLLPSSQLVAILGARKKMPPCRALVCTLVVASASAHTAGAIYHRSGQERLAHGHQISLLAQGEGQQQQQASDSYCISMDGQTMVDDKWCVVSCSNIPPNCPADLCDCVTGSEAKKRYDTVQEALKNATKTKEEVPAVLGAGGNKGEVMNGTADEAGQLAGMPAINGD